MCVHGQLITSVMVAMFIKVILLPSKLSISLYHELVNMQPVRNTIIILFACDVDEEMSGMEEKIKCYYNVFFKFLTIKICFIKFYLRASCSVHLLSFPEVLFGYITGISTITM